MSYPPFFKAAVQKLQEAGIESPQREARLLLAHALQSNADRLMWDMPPCLPDSLGERFNTYLAQRCQQQPLSRILGRREFYGHTFHINEHTLDPRPDSETLIEAIRGAYPDSQQPLTFLDFGTGSGCLVLTLLKCYPAARGIGVDKSHAALKIAQKNASALGVASRVHFICASWDTGLDTPHFPVDVILSNPPYIPLSDAPNLAKGVRAYDPPLALYGGADGLACYRALMAIFGKFPGRPPIFLEVGYDQAPAVIELGKAHGYHNAGIHKDLQGHHRVVALT